VVQIVLCMSRPIKHPKTGVYYYRRLVPEDLRGPVGKREVRVSLKTKTPAKRPHVTRQLPRRLPLNGTRCDRNAHDFHLADAQRRAAPAHTRLGPDHTPLTSPSWGLPIDDVV
jgi:hypothetical protein